MKQIHNTGKYGIGTRSEIFATGVVVHVTSALEILRARVCIFKFCFQILRYVETTNFI
jgi:hypothetical protein